MNRDGCHHVEGKKRLSNSDTLTLICTIISIGAGAYMTTLKPEIIRKSGLGLLSLGVIALCVWVGRHGLAEAQAPSSSGITAPNSTSPIIGGANSGVSIQNSPINGNCNAQGAGTTACSTYDAAPQKLIFSEALKTEILNKIPKNKPGNIGIIGNASDRRVGFEIFNFMKQSGYNVSDPITAEQSIPMPNSPITFTDNPSSWMLVIAPSAR